MLAENTKSAQKRNFPGMNFKIEVSRTNVAKNKQSRLCSKLLTQKEARRIHALALYQQYSRYRGLSIRKPRTRRRNDMRKIVAKRPILSIFLIVFSFFPTLWINAFVGYHFGVRSVFSSFCTAIFVFYLVWGVVMINVALRSLLKS